MSQVFISYRKKDCLGFAGRLSHDLKQHFGERCAFRDSDTIEMGVDFDEAIKHAISESKVLLALIGDRWLVDSQGRRRLDDPSDFVRLEISRALQREQFRLIPILVEGTPMPKAEDLPPELVPLTKRQACSVSDETWEYDIKKLITVLEKLIIVGPTPPPPEPDPQPDPPKPTTKPSLIKATVVHFLIGAGLFVANPNARRKWLYPLIVAAFWGSVAESGDPNGPFWTRWNAGHGYMHTFDSGKFVPWILFLLALFTISLIDVWRARGRHTGTRVPKP